MRRICRNDSSIDDFDQPNICSSWTNPPLQYDRMKYKNTKNSSAGSSFLALGFETTKKKKTREGNINMVVQLYTLRRLCETKINLPEVLSSIALDL